MKDVSFRVNRIEPPNRPCRAWHCALYDTTGFQTRPYAMAFVSEYREDYTILDYVIVPDDFRNQGYAKRLIEECQRHWPGLKMTDRIERGADR